MKSDLDQRLVSGFSEPLDPPLGASAASLRRNLELTHPRYSLQSVLQVLLTDVHRQTWEEAPVVLETSHVRTVKLQDVKMVLQRHHKENLLNRGGGAVVHEQETWDMDVFYNEPNTRRWQEVEGRFFFIILNINQFNYCFSYSNKSFFSLSASCFHRTVADRRSE